MVELNSYSLKTKSDHIIKTNEEIAAIRHRQISLHSNSPACVLTPSEKNLHEISCIEGPAAFLDILSPPYDVDEFGRGPRPCTFFKAIRSKLCAESTDVVEEVQLSVVESSPDFYSSSLEYIGPSLKTYCNWNDILRAIHGFCIRCFTRSCDVTTWCAPSNAFETWILRVKTEARTWSSCAKILIHNSTLNF